MHAHNKSLLRPFSPPGLWVPSGQAGGDRQYQVNNPIHLQRFFSFLLSPSDIPPLFFSADFPSLEKDKDKREFLVSRSREKEETARGIGGYQ